MISVLIPIYNFDVRNLISQLHMQAVSLGQEFEIICLDDASIQSICSLNEIHCKMFSNTRFIKNENNIGRSASRNKLISESLYDWVYMLDCDADIATNFSLLEVFWNQRTERSVLSGGRVYDERAPEDNRFYLHWKWASTRELIKVEERMKDAALHFLSNNFFFHKEIALRIPFDKSLQGYGYEDTLWAAEIIANGFEINHIYNPVKHIGIEPISVFLLKIEESILNLIRLEQLCFEKEVRFPVTSKLYKTGLIILKWPFQKYVNNLFKYLKKKSRIMLNKPNPSLFWLDVFRLSVFVNYKIEKQTTSF